MIVDNTITWDNSAAISTMKSATLTKPRYHSNDKTYALSVVNPSAVTDLTASVYNLRTISGVVRPSYVHSFTVPKAVSATIHDCEAAWDAADGNVTVTADAVDYQVGSKSAKAVVAAGAGIGYLYSDAIVSANYTNMNYVAIRLKSSIALTTGQLVFTLDDTNTGASPLESLSIPSTLAATWTRHYIPLANPELDLAVIFAGIKQTVDLGAFTLNVDDILALKIVANGAYISGIFDDEVDARVEFLNGTALTAVQGFSAEMQLLEV
jgi:hypothetical protein